MFLINATVGPHILERIIVDTLREARSVAKRLAREKSWNLGNGAVFFGDAWVKVYDLDINKPSDHIDEHLLSFYDPR